MHVEVLNSLVNELMSQPVSIAPCGISIIMVHFLKVQIGAGVLGHWRG